MGATQTRMSFLQGMETKKRNLWLHDTKVKKNQTTYFALWGWCIILDSCPKLALAVVHFFKAWSNIVGLQIYLILNSDSGGEEKIKPGAIEIVNKK